MAVLPADHLIPEEKKFQQVLADAFDLAGRGQAIITIGNHNVGALSGNLGAPMFKYTPSLPCHLFPDALLPWLACLLRV